MCSPAKNVPGHLSFFNHENNTDSGGYETVLKKIWKPPRTALGATEKSRVQKRVGAKKKFTHTDGKPDTKLRET